MPEAATKSAKTVYLLYLAAIPVSLLGSFVEGAGFAGFVMGLVGLIMAYANKSSGPAWLDTHFTFQIRTFWIGLLFGIVTAVAYGSLGFTAYFWASAAFDLWWIIRCIKGLMHLGSIARIPNPKSWLFG